MEPGIGVFICSCGNSLNNIDFPWLRRRATRLSDVTSCTVSNALCLKRGLARMVSTISTKHLDRVVIAGCSPQLKEHVFADAMAAVIPAAGLDPGLFCWANLREQCALAHEGEVSSKALDLVRRAVDQAKLMRPVKVAKVGISQEAMIIGGGFSGLTVATELSRLGIRSTVVAKEAILGGQFTHLGVFESALKDALNGLIAAAAGDPDIKLMTAAEVVSVEGTAGRFGAEILEAGASRKANFGAVVIASGRNGGREAGPVVPNIISYDDLARIETELARFPKRIAFLSDDPMELARATTMSVLSGALAIREKMGSDVYVLARSLKVDSGGYERLYREARENGIVFVTFEGRPEISTDGGQLRLVVKDIYIREDLVLDCDLLIVNRRSPLSRVTPVMGIRTDSSGLYQDVNPHLFLSLSERRGVLLVGSCRADVDMARARLEGREAALRIYDLLKNAVVDVPVRVRVEEEKCRACLTCFRACPHGAISMEPSAGRERARIHEVACNACGICAAVCPAKAIEYEGYRDEQILAGIG